MNIDLLITSTLTEEELKAIIKEYCKKLYNTEPTQIEFSIADMTENEGEEEKIITNLSFDSKDASKLLLDKIKPVKEPKPKIPKQDTDKSIIK